MKKINIFYWVLLLASCGLTACKYDTDIPNPSDYVKIYLPQAIEAPAKRTFTMADTLQSIVFGVAYGGPDVPGSAVEVSFKVDENLVQTFNTTNGTNYAVMPSGSYELNQTTATIPSGSVSSLPLKIKVRTNGVLEPFKQYLLPVSIDQVSGNLPINNNLKTAYFLVEAQKEGTSLKVMSFGKGAGIYNMALAADIINQHSPDILLVREMDMNTNRNGKVDQAAVLAPLIGMPHYLFVTSISNFDGGGAYGCTIFSKLPLKQAVTHILPTGDENTEKGPLGVITVELSNGTEIVFAGTHLSSNATRRGVQLPELVKILNTYTTEPLILAGNFNDRPPAGPVYVSLAEAQLIFPCSTCPPNTPVANPVNFSDFIMYKNPSRFRVISHTVGASSTSAHLPVITQFQVYKE
ncbi:DUF1735 domain-containing protein [Rufibacter immobilis]|uniref:DUF1735 domain-containing protein n=1 Tax=Rufibacter immobilis TaxID=1348778 RepID=A0A3M9N5D8_9BACT|nr:DUF1735 domain-containing protein [Rufibacter immobilis]RNI33021.1 DUF1735 domain-containing protein [Rufibacter immobilis]